MNAVIFLFSLFLAFLFFVLGYFCDKVLSELRELKELLRITPTNTQEEDL